LFVTLASLIQTLCDPQAYPAPVDDVHVHQTHISVVFLAGSYAYKIKKPVDLGFVDYSTLEKRRHWCDEEVRLNRRLAPEVYLGVVPVTSDGDHLRIEGTGPVIEWAVKMQRLPEEAMLSSALETERLDRWTIEKLARRIAEFHRNADRGDAIAQHGRFEAVAENARENFEQSLPHVGTTVNACVFERVRTFTEDALKRLRPMIDERAARHRPCDGHGDLRLDHVYGFPDRKPPDDLVIVDCIEFNPRFRAADPVADMAFLKMDLIRHGRQDMAAWFCEAYFDASGDAEGRRLVPFYVAYRSTVRAKVGGMKAAAGEVEEPERARAQAKARAHWLLALGELEDRRQRPCLILVGGLPGSGKSTLAKALADRGSFTVIRSDVVRKELAAAAGAAANQSEIGGGIYTEEFTEQTYHECARRAETELFKGNRVVIDATLRAEARRSRFLELAMRWGVPGLLLVCQADPAVIKSRLESRRNDASDADWAVYLDAARRWEPLAPRTERSAQTIDTGPDWPRPLEQALEALRRADLSE
jgi:aminoglycoside phosphotransferase family enzyme/predicted kinase